MKKKLLAAGMSAIMLLGMVTGCYNNYKLKKFDIDVGDDFTFGKYHDEEIEWEVLQRNFLVDEGKIRIELYSKYVLDCQPFNEDGKATWAECSLREWLNNDFFKEAFSGSEQKQIVETSYFNLYGDDRFLSDKVYLMTLISYRFKPEEAMCEPTEYAEDQGVQMENGYAKYWGRDIIQSMMADTSNSSGGMREHPMVFSCEGGVSIADPDEDKACEADDIGVRPVIWVEFQAPIEEREIEPGDIVTFGKFDGNPIEWIVSDKDRDGLTLFSRYGLLDKKMDKGDVDDFEETSLHDWLNDDFYNDSFSNKQKKIMVEFDNDDYVRLMGWEELKECRSNIGYELFTGYTKAFYDDHPELADELPSLQKIIDEWWTMDMTDKDENLFRTYDPSSMGRVISADEERSVRPVIKITID